MLKGREPMKAHHGRAASSEDLQDLWSLIDQRKDSETDTEPESEKTSEADTEPEDEKTEEPQSLTIPAASAEVAPAPAPGHPCAALWVEKMLARVPVTVRVVPLDGKTLYEHERYPGLLVDMDAYRAGHYDMPHLDERWFAVQLMRYDTEHGPMPWGEDLPQHRPPHRENAAVAQQWEEGG